MPTSDVLLHLISRDQLIALGADQTREHALDDCIYANPFGILTHERIPHENRVRDVIANPDHMKWYYRLIIERDTTNIVGSISFHAAPDESGMIEVGLGIAEPAQGKGYAQSALRQMWDWAVTQPDVQLLRYTVSPDNAPSMAIIQKFGFPQIGEQIDEEDGLELIFELPVSQYKPAQ